LLVDARVFEAEGEGGGACDVAAGLAAEVAGGRVAAAGCAKAPPHADTSASASAT
jgi:hypothetical protein